MPTQAAQPTGTAQTRAVDLRPLLARITRDQGPEFEQTLPVTPLAQVSTPTSLRTDRKIKWLDFHLRVRLTNGATAPTFRSGPPLLGVNNSNVLFSLFQQVTIRGQHLKYGSQTVIQIRGETAAELAALVLPNYIPQYSVSQSGGPLVKFGPLSTTAAATNDVDLVLPIPLYPHDLSASDATMHAIHGPDWPGNFFVDILWADGTALATTNAPTLSAFGSTSGNGTVDIHSERPLLGKDYMSSIRGAITYRIFYSTLPTSTVAVVGGTGAKLSDLTVGKDTSRIFLKTGTQQVGNGPGVITYGTLSDAIVTRTFFSLDARQLRFQSGANSDALLQDYMGRSYLRTIPAGYRMIDFISTTTPGSANPKMSFGSSQLTAARKFELDGDTNAASNQIAEVVQEMILGAPGITTG